MSASLHPIRRAEIRNGAIDALFELPECIGRYEVRGELGRGGMGVVYDGFDLNLTREVAVKLINEECLNEADLSNAELVERFEREMRATSRLFHPNLVAILDAGVTTVRGKTRAFYVMERVGGESLEGRLRRSGPMRREEGLKLAIAVTRGLAAVHAEGLVHRDLKPSNILLGLRGEAKLTDFGLCQWRSDPARGDAKGSEREEGILGSPHYLSPEQVTHRDVDFRADLFSLGAVLVHVFSGAPPFPASSLSEHFGRIVADDPDGLSRLDRDVRELVCELLRKTPGQRPDSAEAVIERLEELAGVSRRQASRGGTLRRISIATGALALAAVVSGVWLQQDLVQMRAETQLRRQQLSIQLERARALTATLAHSASSAEALGPDARSGMRDEATGTLNRVAVERRRYEESASRLSARLQALPWSLLAALVTPAPGPLAGELESRASESAVYDPESYLDARELSRLEQQLRLLQQELQVEVRVLFVTPPPERSLEAFGIDVFDAFRERGLGPDSRSLLLLVDGASGRVRVEVGYELEPVLTDELAGALARQHLVPVLDAKEPGFELRMILRVVRQRLRNAVLAGTFELREARGRRSRHDAGGAGASAAAASAEPSKFDTALGPVARLRYGPGATVREAYQRYQLWLREGNFDATVGLFTSESRELLSKWPATRVYIDQMSSSPIAGPVEVVSRDGRAILYALRDPLAPPHFFRRSASGWQIDLAARERHVIPIAGGAFSWTLSKIGELPLSKFRDELEPVEGLIRVRGGDNRTLVASAAPWQAPALLQKKGHESVAFRPSM